MEVVDRSVVSIESSSQHPAVVPRRMDATALAASAAAALSAKILNPMPLTTILSPLYDSAANPMGLPPFGSQV